MWLRQTGAFWRYVSPRVVHVRRQIKAFLTRLIQAEFLSAFGSGAFAQSATQSEVPKSRNTRGNGRRESLWVDRITEWVLPGPHFHISDEVPIWTGARARQGLRPDPSTTEAPIIRVLSPTDNCQLDLTIISYTLKKQMLKLTRTTSNYFKGMIQNFDLCM